MSLSQQEKKALIEWAMEWMDFDPEELSTSRSGFEKHKQQYSLRRLTEETFPIHKMEITQKDIKTDLLGIIQDLSIEKDGYIEDMQPHFPVEETISEDGLIDVYTSKVNKVIENAGKRTNHKTKFYFPMNILMDESIREIDVLDTKFTRMSESEWSDRIQQFKGDPDIFNAHTVQSLCEGRELTYWKSEIESKSSRYASNKFRAGCKLLLSKINHCLYLWESELDNRFRWSNISEPFSVLISAGGQPEEVSIVDNEPNQSVEVAWEDDRFCHLFEKFPRFQYNADGTEKVLQDALLEYQRAVVETDRHDAFMTFWRCIEELSLADNGQKSEIVDRAKWALRNVERDHEHIDFINKVSDEMYDTRNNWVHESNWDDIWRSHEYVAKYLCDAMLQIYINHLFDKEIKTVRRIFSMSTMEERENKKKQILLDQKAIEEVSNIES